MPKIADTLLNLELLEGRVSNLQPSMATADAAAAGWAIDEVDRFAADAVALLERGDAPGALGVIEGEFDAAYDELVRVVSDERAERLNEMGLTQAGAGRLANAVRFVVGFFVPLGAVISYALLARRRQARRDLEHRYERQKAVMEPRTSSSRVSRTSCAPRSPASTGIRRYFSRTGRRTQASARWRVRSSEKQSHFGAWSTT